MVFNWVVGRPSSSACIRIAQAFLNASRRYTECVFHALMHCSKGLPPGPDESGMRMCRTGPAMGVAKPKHGLCLVTTLSARVNPAAMLT